LRYFLAAGTTTANQIAFINTIVDHLTIQGVMEPALLDEQPFASIAPMGPERLFDKERVTRIFAKIQTITDSAVV
jgi:type I restriction enzyme R subunit